MMESQNPPESRFPPPRRIATAPDLPTSRRSLSVSSTNPRASGSGGSRGPADLVETLYNHPSVKIIAFTSSQRSSLASSSPTVEPPPGSLPASSQLERTIAVGSFRIYRAPGSVAFLSCGSALQPILPKSQCWSINEANSQFVLQIRRPQYWRIEIPVADPDDAHRAFILRDVFDKILLFEKTECPFQRTFTVELPQRPQTPVKKKPWTPIGKNLVSSPFLSDHSPPSPSPRLVSETRRRMSTAFEVTNTTENDPSAVTENVPDVPAAHTPNDHDEAAVFSTVQSSDGTQENFDGRKEPDIVAHPAKEIVSTEHEVLQGPLATQTVDRAIEDDSKIEALLIQPQSAQAELESVPILADPCFPPRELDPIRSQNTKPQTTPRISEDTPMRTPSISEEVKGFDTTISQYTKPQAPSRISNVTPIRTLSISDGTRGIEPKPTEPLEPITALQTAASIKADELMTLGTTTPPNETPRKHLLALDRSLESSKEDSHQAVSASTEDYVGDADVDGPSTFEGAGGLAPVNLKKKRMSRLLAGRTVTLPPQLTLITSPPSKYVVEASRDKPTAQQPTPAIPPPSRKSEDASPVGSLDSFHSVQSWHSPITPLPPSPPSSQESPSPPSFPYPHQNITIPKRHNHVRDVSDLTMTPDTDGTMMPSSAGATAETDDTASPMPRSPVDDSKPSSPTSPETSVDVARSSAVAERPEIRHRARPNNLSISRRALSPLPSAANLFSPPIRRRPTGRLEVVRKLPSAIIHKTMEILLSPPSHLVNLMLRVAAKIAAGEWRGLVLGFGEGGEKIPVQWDYSDGEFSSWGDDDDYHFSMGRFGQQRHASNESVPKTGSHRNSTPEEEASRSWEVD